MEPSQLLAEAALHGSSIAALALAVGIPVGWYAQRAIGDLLTSEIGIGPGLTFGPSTTGLTSIAIATLALGALGTAAAVWPSLRSSSDALLADE